MKRGEIWVAKTVGRERTVLLVGADPVNSIHNSVQCVEIRNDQTIPETLVSVRLSEADPVSGVAYVADVGPYRKERLSSLLGRADPGTMERIEVALRAVFDL
ncbi:MAG: type II toxin-antitoxin system PemK/MazF family toxin [Mycobacteriales bacterium]